MQLLIRGKLTGLEKFNRKLQRVATAADVVADNVAEEVVDMIAEGFSKESDPYGNKWLDKKHDDGRSILVGKTTRLRRASTRAQPITRGKFMAKSKARSGKRGAIGVRFLNYQAGSGKTPPRPMIPDSRGMAPSWRPRAKLAAIEAIRKRIK